MHRRLAVALLFGTFACSGVSQTPLMDARGSSSLFLPDSGGFLQFNLADGRATIAYLRDVSNLKNWFGVQVSGKLAGDKSSLFRQSSLQDSASLNFSLGERWVLIRKPKAGPEPSIDPEGAARFKYGIPFGTPFPNNVYVFDSEKVKEHLKANVNLVSDSIIADFNGNFGTSIVPGGNSNPNYGRLIDDLIKGPQLDSKIRFLLSLGPKDNYPVKLRRLNGELLSTRFNLDLDVLTGEPKSASSPRSPLTGDYDWLVFDFGVSRSTHRLIDPTKPVADQISKRGIDNTSIRVAYNRQIGGSAMFGLSAGYERGSNADSLDEVTVEDITDLGSGRIITSSTAALLGDLKRTDRTPIAVDLAFWPAAYGSRIGVNLFARVDLRDTKNTFVPGIGFFLSEKGSPLKVQGGLSLSVVKGRVITGLVAGFNF